MSSYFDHSRPPQGGYREMEPAMREEELRANATAYRVTSPDREPMEFGSLTLALALHRARLYRGETSRLEKWVEAYGSEPEGWILIQEGGRCR